MPDTESPQNPPDSADANAKVGIKGIAPETYGVRDQDSDTIKELKINSATDLYRGVIVFLGAIVLLVVAVSGIILGKYPDANIPDGLIAIGSAAVGAIAGMLAQSPSK
jgi:hypothetical protein